MLEIKTRRRSPGVGALALAALLLAPIGALAASPEDDYLAARDRDIAALKTLEAPQDWPAHKVMQEKDTADLEQRLRAIIGPFAMAGFPAEGKLNADLYAGDPSFGEIDGLVYNEGEKTDGVDALIVTTAGLLDKWLPRHPRRWSKSELPRAAAAAATEAFYTQGLTRQGNVERYAPIPVIAPHGAKFAEAMLATVDAGPELPEAPDRLFIALEKGGRVFLVSVAPAIPIKGVGACDTLLTTYEIKAQAAETANAGASHAKSQGGPDALRAAGRAAFVRCFSGRIKTAPEFKAATKQAAAMTEALAGK